MAQHEPEVIDFDLLSSGVGGALCGVVACFDDEVGKNFVENEECCREGVRSVAEGEEDVAD